MAFGAGTVSSIGGAVSDLFAAEGTKFKARAERLKASGDRLEQAGYLKSAGFADQNVVYNENATAIKKMQLDRQLSKATGTTEADIAGAGFSLGGSALDILRDSATQGALTKAVVSEQGLITEEGYKQQAESYRTMADAAGISAQISDESADDQDRVRKDTYISAGIKGAAALASLVI